MNLLNLSDIISYIHEHIGPEYHDKKLAKLKEMTLDDVIKRKNPYLFKAKQTNDATEFVKAVLDATISSREETVFGNFLENVGIYVCERVYGGRKSGIKGIDLEFEEGTTKYLVSIKSGPNWGNSGQIQNLLKNFSDAKKTLSTSSGAKRMHIVCIEACCYGVDDKPEKGTRLKLCGQRFWALISGGSETLYRDIIEPLGHLAREKNDELEALYLVKKNLFVKGFVNRFCNEGVIDWDRLVIYNSGKKNAS